MSNFSTLWKTLNEDRVNESFGDPIPKEFKDSINKTVDKLKDISDGISKSINYLNRMKRDLTGGESINDIEERKAEIIKKLSEFSKLDFESVLGIDSVQQNEETINESKVYARDLKMGDVILQDGVKFKIDSVNKSGIEASDNSEVYLRGKVNGKNEMRTYAPDDRIEVEDK